MCPQHERTDISARADALVVDMLRCEEIAHCCDDYHLDRHQQQRAHNCVWREKVTEWCYKVVDYIGEDREVVYLCMRVLDRYLAMDSPKHRTNDPVAYQVAALTALLLVIKFRGKVSFGAKELLQMRRGDISPQEVARTAKEMAKCLSWQNLLPSPSAFVRNMLEFLPREDVGQDAWSSILDNATYFVEVSVCDSFFSDKKSSAVAFAAIHYAIDREASSTLSWTAKSTFLSRVENLTGLRRDSSTARTIYSRLRYVYSQSSGLEDAKSNLQTTADVIPCDEDEVATTQSSTPLSAISSVVSCEDVALAASTPQDGNGMKRIQGYTSLLDLPTTKRIRLCSQV